MGSNYSVVNLTESENEERKCEESENEDRDSEKGDESGHSCLRIFDRGEVSEDQNCVMIENRAFSSANWIGLAVANFESKS